MNRSFIPFWQGVASILDIGGTLQDEPTLPCRRRKLDLYRHHVSFQSDAEALQGDWRKVERDVEVAAKKSWFPLSKSNHHETSNLPKHRTQRQQH